MHGVNRLVCAEVDASHFDKDKTPHASVTQQTARMQNEPEQDVIVYKQRTLYANANISDARLTDRFQEDGHPVCSTMIVAALSDFVSHCKSFKSA